MPDYVVEIGESAFCSTGAESIVIPKNVTKIDSEAFASCANLSSIKVADDNPVFMAKSNCLISKKDNMAVFGCEPCTIPTYVVGLAEKAFYGSNIESIVLPDNITVSGKYAFMYCNQLKTITLSPNMEVIPFGFMKYCTSLTELTIPYGVKEICP